LIEAQTTQGDMLELNTPPTYLGRDESSVPLSTRPPASSYGSSICNSSYAGNFFVPAVKKLDKDQLIADIDDMIQAQVRRKEPYTV